MQYNIQGITPDKISELNIILSGSKIKVISLNEHWLKNDTINILNSIHNMVLADFYVRVNGLRGGSCLLVEKNCNFVTRKEFMNLYEDFIFECCCIELTNLNTMVLSIYTVPNYSFKKIFFNKLEKLFVGLKKLSNKMSVYILGDFNVNMLDSNSFSSKFKDIVQCNGFSFQFNEPTRILSNSSTCLDNIIVQSSFDVKCKINIDLGLSDHNALIVNLPCNHKTCETKSHSVTKKRCFSKENIANFVDSLKKDTIFIFDQSLSPDENYNNFLRKFLLVFNSVFPLKTMKKNQKRKPVVLNWVTQGIQISSKRKRELHRESKFNKNQNFLSYVKMYKKIFKQVVINAKKMSNASYIKKSDNKSRAIWQIVNKTLGKDKCNLKETIVLKDKNNMEIRNPDLLASSFNDFFVNITQNINLPQVKVKGIHTSVKQICVNKNASLSNFQLCNKTEVLKVIQSLKNKNSVGWDEVPICLIKAAADVIAEPLVQIINQGLTIGYFPEKLKYSQITPVFKNGSYLEISNYRPISVLSNFSKIFEKIINFRLLNYFEDFNLFYSKQYGFRKNLSTQAALTDFANEIATALDRSQATAGVFCDLSKAFDCVDHSALLLKLNNYGINGNCLALLKSYLSFRKQRTVITSNNSRHFSQWENISIGVPQGSILGPVFFLIYINDLPKSINKELILFADDTTAILKSPNNTDLFTDLTEIIRELESWFSLNGLKLNIAKTQAIKFSIRKENIDNDNFQNLVSSHKFLGIQFDQNLNWKVHIEYIQKKLRSIAFAFLHLRDSVSFEICKTVYHAYVESILRYGIELWGQASEIKAVFTLQKRIIRIMTHSHPRSTCKPLFKNLKIFTLSSLYVYEILTNLHALKRNLPDETRFHHEYNTRNSAVYRLPTHRSTVYQKCPLYTGLKLYNNLPIHFQNMNIDQFKESLKAKLHERTIYSVKELFDAPFR